jgi:hypothetical protein
MSAVKGAIRTDYDDTPRSVRKPDQVGGVKRHIYDEYEAAALASGSTITVGVPLPIGARVSNVTVMTDALGTSSTLAVGDAGDADRYLTAFSSASAGKMSMTGANGAIDGWFHQVTGDDDADIVITTGGAAVTGTIKIDVEYIFV